MFLVEYRTYPRTALPVSSASAVIPIKLISGRTMTLRLDENKLPYIDLGKDVQLRLDFTEYSDKKSLDKAQDELRETPEVVESALRELRALLSGKNRVHLDHLA